MEEGEESYTTDRISDIEPTRTDYLNESRETDIFLTEAEKFN